MSVPSATDTQKAQALIQISSTLTQILQELQQIRVAQQQIAANSGPK